MKQMKSKMHAYVHCKRIDDVPLGLILYMPYISNDSRGNIFMHINNRHIYIYIYIHKIKFWKKIIKYETKKKSERTQK